MYNTLSSNSNSSSKFKFKLKFEMNNFLFYNNLNFTGKLNFTFTALPCCLPGFHLGICFTTLIASSAKPPPGSLSTSMSVISPSVFIINER